MIPLLRVSILFIRLPFVVGSPVLEPSVRLQARFDDAVFKRVTVAIRNLEASMFEALES